MPKSSAQRKFHSIVGIFVVIHIYGTPEKKREENQTFNIESKGQSQRKIAKEAD